MIQPRHPQFTKLLLPSLIALSLNGCATKEYVQQEVGAVNQRIEALSSKMTTAYQRIDGNALLILDAGKRISTAEQSASTLDQRLQETQSGLTQASRRLEGMSLELKSSQERIDANTRDITHASQRIDALDARLTAAQTQAQGTAAQVASAEQRLGSLESALNGLQTARADVQTPPAQAEPSRSAEAAAQTAPGSNARDESANPGNPSMLLAASNQRLNEIAAQLAAAGTRIEANASALESSSQRIGKVEASLSEAGKRIEDSAAALAAANTRIGELQGHLTASSQQVSLNATAIADVAQKVDAQHARLGAAQEQLEHTAHGLTATNARLDTASTTLGEHTERLARNETEDNQIAIAAKAAMEEAAASRNLAQGKLVYETVLSEERTGFSPYKSNLTAADELALKEFADRLRAENKNVYLEIQGHTDNSGPAARNLDLSRARAETVRSFLHEIGGIPLHRMSIAAYGERKPVADNATPSGRSQNRRVVIVVIH